MSAPTTPPLPRSRARSACLCLAAALVSGLALASACGVGEVIFARPPPDGGCGDMPCSTCLVAADCEAPEEHVCQGNLCIPICADGVKDGRETDVDCGGTCSKCSDGRRCAASDDCESGACDAGQVLPAVR